MSEDLWMVFDSDAWQKKRLNTHFKKYMQECVVLIRPVANYTCS